MTEPPCTCRACNVCGLWAATHGQPLPNRPKVEFPKAIPPPAAVPKPKPKPTPARIGLFDAWMEKINGDQ